MAGAPTQRIEWESCWKALRDNNMQLGEEGSEGKNRLFALQEIQVFQRSDDLPAMGRRRTDSCVTDIERKEMKDFKLGDFGIAH